MQNEPIVHEANHPIEASAGGNNAYYLRNCPVVERGPSYASCLSRLHDIDGGRVNERTAQCDQAVRQNRCIAAGMRDQEKLAGQALFYFPRTNKPFLPVAVAGEFGVLITNLTDPELIPKAPRPYGERAKVVPSGSTKLGHELQTDVMAAAINNAVRMPPLPTMEEVRQAIEALPPEQLPALAPTIASAAMVAKADAFLKETHGDFVKAVENAKPDLKEKESGPLAGKITVAEVKKTVEEPVPMAANMVAQMSAGNALKIQPGETPLQFARRMAALRNKK